MNSRTELLASRASESTGVNKRLLCQVYGAQGTYIDHEAEKAGLDNQTNRELTDEELQDELLKEQGATAPARPATDYSVALDPKKRPDVEEKMLRRVVHELKFGTLDKSIKLLKGMVKAYPTDSDYRSLLFAAESLKTGDIWYQYQSRDRPRPILSVPTITRPVVTRSKPEREINQLKKSSWYLMYKGGWSHPGRRTSDPTPRSPASW